MWPCLDARMILNGLLERKLGFRVYLSCFKRFLVYRRLVEVFIMHALPIS